MAARSEASPIGAILAPIVAMLTFVGETSLIFWDALKRILRPPYEVKETINQMAFLGVASVPIVVLTSFFSGAVFSLYLTTFLQQYGATTFVGATIGVTATREMGPVLAGLMVAARGGSAMAAQIGTMSVTEQIDALKMLSVHPTNYLVIPRMIAGIVMLPILAMVAMYSSILGGLVVAAARGVSVSVYLSSIQQYCQPTDFTNGLIKAPFFGLIIALVSCQQGLRTKDGAVGVGRSTTNAVVISMVLIYVADYVLASFMY